MGGLPRGQVKREETREQGPPSAPAEIFQNFYFYLGAQANFQKKRRNTLSPTPKKINKNKPT